MNAIGLPSNTGKSPIWLWLLSVVLGVVPAVSLVAQAAFIRPHGVYLCPEFPWAAATVVLTAALAPAAIVAALGMAFRSPWMRPTIFALACGVISAIAGAADLFPRLSVPRDSNSPECISGMTPDG